MKLTTLLALGTALVTLAQKPTLEPQKDWSKERTQLWLDSLVKSLTQETKPAQNVNSGGYYNQNPTITDEQIRINKYEDEVNAKYRTERQKKFQDDGITEITKNLEEADFIFQGIIYEQQIYQPNSNPNIEKKYNVINGYAHVLCKAMVFEIFRKNPNYSIRGENFTFKLNNKGINSNGIATFTVKSGEITTAIYYSTDDNLHYFFPKSNLILYPKNRLTFKKDTFEIFINKFKNLDFSNEFILNWAGAEWSETVKYYTEKGLDFNGFLKELRKFSSVKKKAQQGLRNSRIENTQANSVSFTVSDFNPKTIRAGLGERLTIIGSGFGNTYNPNLHIQFRNADIGGNPTGTLNGYLLKLDAMDYVQTAWSNTRIVIILPSVVSASASANDNINTGTPGSGFFNIISLDGNNLVLSSVTSPMAINIEYAVTNFANFNFTSKIRSYLPHYS